MVAPANFVALTFDVQAATLTLADGDVLRTRLVVGADGLGSWIRQASGLTTAPRAYAQTAVVANFDCEYEHHGRASQWFLANGGVLAWLPLPERRISIVWSAPTALAGELAALPAGELALRVADAGAHALGALTLREGEGPVTFALSFLRLPSVVAHRLALVGDAAHGIHPLAGQGVNLGFGDVTALAGVLAERGPIADAGAPILLERYARRRAEPVLAMQTVTDALARLFSLDRRWLSGLRNQGMSTIDRFPLIKRALAQPALR
jgi:ubiquinone biosynthesis UbiH/UbiF/VisC/COQ6 family hydroxylase